MKLYKYCLLCGGLNKHVAKFCGHCGKLQPSCEQYDLEFFRDWRRTSKTRSKTKTATPDQTETLVAYDRATDGEGVAQSAEQLTFNQ